MGATKCKYPLVVVATATIFCFALAKYKAPYEQEKTKLAEMFKKFHPDLGTLDLLDWDLADKITEERLEKVCCDVANEITPEFLVNQTNYLPPIRVEKTLQMDTVVRYAPVLFPVEGMKYMTLIKCTFEEIDFYIGMGNDSNHVFAFSKDRVDNIFYFRSGLHEIHYV